MEEAKSPPAASDFLQKHTHHSDDAEAASSSVRSSGATEMVSNLIEGLVGGGGTGGSEDDASMKHRKERNSYDQRLPKMTGKSNVPYKDFDHRGPLVPEETRPGPFAGLRYRLRGFFSPRATDIQQLLVKLQKQFDTLEVEHNKYLLMRDGSRWDDPNPAPRNQKEDMDDPKNPLNDPSLIREVHFVGRKAIDPSVIQLSTFLMNYDSFGTITELWLNDNLISDDGAAAIASFLQLPTCALLELWLGSNQIGPQGTTLISAALSNNSNSQLKCLGLYLNPIGNAGAMTLAQMLRKNHTLSTVDVHGCGCRSKGPAVLEGYGCKVIKASDGTEYVARVVAPPDTEEEKGLVTDQRLLDAIQTFVAFNRINPTREQAIRGIMSSNKQSQKDTPKKETGDNTNEEHHQSHISNFLSELSNKPGSEKLSDEEKLGWKSCEWERLYVELERARAAKAALSNRFAQAVVDDDKAKNNEEEEGLIGSAEEGKMANLDDEVVTTDTRSWRELKMGITGTVEPNPRERKAPQSKSTGNDLYTISDADGDDEEEVQEKKRPASPPQNSFPANIGKSEGVEAGEELESALETVATVEEENKAEADGDSEAAK